MIVATQHAIRHRQHNILYRLFMMRETVALAISLLMIHLLTTNSWYNMNLIAHQLSMYTIHMQVKRKRRATKNYYSFPSKHSAFELCKSTIYFLKFNIRSSSAVSLNYSDYEFEVIFMFFGRLFFGVVARVSPWKRHKPIFNCVKDIRLDLGESHFIPKLNIYWKDQFCCPQYAFTHLCIIDTPLNNLLHESIIVFCWLYWWLEQPQIDWYVVLVYQIIVAAYEMLSRGLKVKLRNIQYVYQWSIITFPSDTRRQAINISNTWLLIVN